ncbi:TIGR04086 family membrane protein [Flavonifractor sp. An92]|uniref:TIGR04086 family membrane protein n=1 Tax=Flavonifractor sp. An92 TaxID=1965666 RepID=UPI001FA8C5C6|nr:TIGR04086 family membrane protein [Flavonifractor sp. An92]
MAKREEEPGKALLRCATGVLLGGAVAFAVSLALLLLASCAISAGAMGEELSGRVTVAACVLGAFCGGIAAVRRCGRRALVVGLATGAVFFLLLLTIGALAFGSVPQDGRGVLVLCAALCGGAAAGLLGRREKKRRK